MSLEEQVKEAGKEYRTFQQAAGILEKDKDNYAAREQLALLVESITPANKADTTVKASNSFIDDTLKNYDGITKNRLNSVVDGNFKKVLAMLSKEGLIDLVLSVAPQEVKDKQYEEFRKAHEEYIALAVAVKTGNTEIYINTVEEGPERKVLADKVNEMSERDILGNMTKYRAELRKKAEDKLKGKSIEYIRGYLTRSYSKANVDHRKGMNIAAGALVK